MDFGDREMTVPELQAERRGDGRALEMKGRGVVWDGHVRRRSSMR